MNKASLVFLFFAAFLVAKPSLAQIAEPRDFSAERYEMTPSRTGVIDVEAGRLLPHLGWDVGLHLGIAHDPLVLYRESDGRQLGSLVQHRFGGSLVGSLGLFNWVELGLEMPFTLYQWRPSNQPGITSSSLETISAAGFGDLRIDPKVRILRAAQHHVDFAVLVPFRVPTGFSREYLGQPSVSFSPKLAVSRHFVATDKGPKGLVLAANLGLDIRKATAVANLLVESELTYGFGVGYRFKEIGKKPFWLDLALSGSTSLLRPFRNANQNSLELRVQGSYEITKRWLIFAGLGVGLLRGFGTPDIRATLGVRFGDVDPVAASTMPVDRDADGLFDDVDNCPSEYEPELAGDPRDGCPVRDSDGDGLDDLKERSIGTNPLDADSDDDGCIDGAELEPTADSDGDGSINALDPDSDNDGLPDGLELGQDKAHKDTDLGRGSFFADAEPLSRTSPLKADTDGGSVRDGAEDTNKNGRVDDGESDPAVAEDDVRASAPVKDRDLDGILDGVDSCPDQAGLEKHAGCPAPMLVTVKENKLVILESVRFETGKDVIRDESFGILNNVVTVLTEHPEYKRISVQGHTDNQGGRSANLDLSKRRAAAVVRYLVEKGLDPARLESLGFGADKPINTNDTAAGREKNRRVEFLILESAQ